jgi:hypothetical protein
MRLPTGSVLGTFSKGNEYSLSLNFGVSGGRHCDANCVHHPQSIAPDPERNCYAVRSELRGDRAGLAHKLQRHETLPPSRVVGKAILELKELIDRGKRIDWLRVSTNGSLPQWNSPSCSNLFKSQFMALLKLCDMHNIKVHIPVETKEKADGYRNLCGSVVVIRESVQDPDVFVSADGAVSTSAGVGLRLLDRIKACQTIAKMRLEATGRKSIVCPAVTASFKRKVECDASKMPMRIKAQQLSRCGTCDACANPSIDIIYPAH